MIVSWVSVSSQLFKHGLMCEFDVLGKCQIVSIKLVLLLAYGEGSVIVGRRLRIVSKTILSKYVT